ncbi:CPBP family intramembrane glutamic endopeptidase [Bacillus sp. T33-2]|uniref:CPBP family intramembrane glutamic endopeptidase n=1 Tax=Bacillus sp. T33-2 TaxID=2054168 RepID=UPI000C780989|nr:CPBP family intramembrane glutamic endopeptidase [Bacillus sp. T33-2]PLR97552.1 CPBP family intramembrane metalloprotease domain-containing protein [Bacillus sp. T33-2]
MGGNFIKIAAGRNNWKRFLSSFVLLLGFMFLGSIAYFTASGWYVTNDGDPASYYDAKKAENVHIDPLADFVLSHIIYVFWFFGLALLMRLIHKRSIKTLITADKNLNWKKVAWGFAVFFSLIAGTTIIDFILNPSDYSLNNIEVTDFFKLFLFVLILTPLQTTSEELLFRGYLMQWFGRKINNALLLSLIVGFIFASLHFSNPEMGYSRFFVGSDYLISGVLWCYISAKTNSSELTIGAHAANNMFIGWFLTMDDSVYGNIPSLFVVTNIDPKISLLWTIISMGIFTYFSLKKFGGLNKPPGRLVS